VVVSSIISPGHPPDGNVGESQTFGSISKKVATVVGRFFLAVISSFAILVGKKEFVCTKWREFIAEFKNKYLL
jgi:hypothetical protein